MGAVAGHGPALAPRRRPARRRRLRRLLSTNSYLTAWFTRIPRSLEVYDLVAFDPALRSSSRAAADRARDARPAGPPGGGIVCISQATADELLTRFPARPGAVTVAPLGRLAGAAAPRRWICPPAFVLAVGTLEPRKNLPRLVEAFTRLREDLQAAHPLLLAGRSAGTRRDDRRDAGLGERCRLIGPSRTPTSRAVRAPHRLLPPSLDEGFGLPVLEAMAAGAAVITSGVSSLPRSAATPSSTCARRQRSIAAALERLLRDPERRGALGPRRASAPACSAGTATRS